jgi:hypothetical protein
MASRTHRPETPLVVAALPGAGWQALYRAEDGTSFVSPVLAWLVFSDGTIEPVDMGTDGYSEDPRESTSFVRLVEPGGDPS